MDAQKGITNTLSEQVKTLESAANDAKLAAEAAKKSAAEAADVAKKAQAAGNDALTQAQEALTKAKTAEEAVATVKAEAIEQAKNETQALLDEVLKGYVSNETLTDELTKLEGKLSNLVSEEINKLTPVVNKLREDVDKNAADILEQKGQLTSLEETLKAQIIAFNKYKEDIQVRLGKIDSKITEEVTRIDGLIKDLQSQINVINETLKAHGNDIEALKKAVKDIQNEIDAINEEIEEINSELSLLKTVLTNRLTSITLLPDHKFPYAGNAINFYSLEYSPMGNDENDEVETNINKFTKSISKNIVARYHFNPRTFNTANADYAIDGIYTELTYPDVNDNSRSVNRGNEWVEIIGSPVKDLEESTQNFTLKRKGAFSRDIEKEIDDQDKGRHIALQASLKGDAIDPSEKDAKVVVTSDYAYVNDIIYTSSDLYITEEASIPVGVSPYSPADSNCKHYATTFAEAASEDYQANYTFAYDEVFNLSEKDATCLHREHLREGVSKFDVEAYGLSYRYSVASSEFNIQSENTNTNQQAVIECTSATDGTFQAIEHNPEAIGRTPILKIELVDSENNVVRRAFVKVLITANKKANVTVNAKNEFIKYNCADTHESFVIDETQMREEVYRVLTNGKVKGISHTEFWQMYEDANEAFVTKNGSRFEMPAPKVVDGNAEDGTATKKIVWEFDHNDLQEIGVGSSFVGELTLKNKIADNDYPAEIKFYFNLTVTLPKFEFTEKVENKVLWRKDSEGNYTAYVSNVVVPDDPKESSENCIFMTSLNQAYSAYVWDFENHACNETKYRIAGTYVDGNPTDAILNGVKLIVSGDDTFISLDKTDEKVKAALNSLNGGLNVLVEHVAVLNSGDEIVINSLNVAFVRPIDLNLPATLSVKDAVTGGDTVDFRQHEGLLTDWVGNNIIKKEQVRIERDCEYWKYSPLYTLQTISEGYYKLVHEGSIKVEQTEIEMTAVAGTSLYSGSIKVKYYVKKKAEPRSEYKTSKDRYTITEEQFYSKTYLTKSDVVTDLNAQAKAHLYALSLVKGKCDMDFDKKDIRYTEETVTVGAKVKYNTIKVVKEIAPAYEWVEPVVEYRPEVINKRPRYKGKESGQRDGMWVWISRHYDRNFTVPGNYWKFYGKFEDIKLDVDNVTTNLYGGKLPATASLEQVDDSSVLYNNVQSPVQESYEIYVPVELTYGWGTIKDQITIIVNPSIK